MSYAEIGKQLSTLADAYDVKLPRELVLIGKQFLYVERYMKLLAPKWQMMSRPAAHRVLRQLHGRGQPRAHRRASSDEHDRRGLTRGDAICAPAPPRSGDLDIHYEDMGDPNDPAVLLIMGLGAQLVLWRKGFCEKLVDQGLRVIRYDNRDVGLSDQADRASARAASLVPTDGALVPRAAQPGGLHARGHGRRRRGAAGPPRRSTRRTSSARRWAA